MGGGSLGWRRLVSFSFWFFGVLFWLVVRFVRGGVSRRRRSFRLVIGFWEVEVFYDRSGLRFRVIGIVWGVLVAGFERLSRCSCCNCFEMRRWSVLEVKLVKSRRLRF